jgi:hypothetical protein
MDEVTFRCNNRLVKEREEEKKGGSKARGVNKILAWEEHSDECHFILLNFGCVLFCTVVKR